jgi:hypothetical protein
VTEAVKLPAALIVIRIGLRHSSANAKYQPHREKKRVPANPGEGLAASHETKETRHDYRYRHGKPSDDRPTRRLENENRQSENQGDL